MEKLIMDNEASKSVNMEDLKPCDSLVDNHAATEEGNCHIEEKNEKECLLEVAEKREVPERGVVETMATDKGNVVKPSVDLSVESNIEQNAIELDKKIEQINVNIEKSQEIFGAISLQLQSCFQEKSSFLTDNLTDVIDSVEQLKNEMIETKEEISSLEVRYESMIAEVQKKNSRIQRLEEGYDYQILKNFSRQVIREIRSQRMMQKRANCDEKKKIYQEMIDFLEELLERNSIVKIKLEVGETYAGNEKLAECDAVKVYTEDISLKGRIATILREGYQYEFNEDSNRVIEPAKVRLFTNEPVPCSDKICQYDNAEIEEQARENMRTQELRNLLGNKSRKNGASLYIIIKYLLLPLFLLILLIVFSFQCFSYSKRMEQMERMINTVKTDMERKQTYVEKQKKPETSEEFSNVVHATSTDNITNNQSSKNLKTKVEMQENHTDKQ